MRNIFKGGPLDGNVLMTDIITDGGEFVTYLPIEEYDGSNPPEQGIDGQYQRTWYWTGVGEVDPGEPLKPNLKPEHEAAAVFGAPSKSPTLPTPSQDKTEQSRPSHALPEPASTPKPSASVDSGWGSFRARREARKLSRGPIADASGLTVAKVARVETKGGTDEEIAAYEKALRELEDA